ncbi:hypothetical protein evm_013552 [Chilo suppressalis]|nr:hypothetical protein evm_013552 [Chilo suppressalis]
MNSKRNNVSIWAIVWLLKLPFFLADSMTTTLKHVANVSYSADNIDLSSLATIFSPRMDFDQWKPLTGRGDPLRKDPTYDYEPPVLERVHYWADDTRLEREQYPERKSEVLMLGVSSRKSSVAHRQPPPRRHPRPTLPKYEDFTYKINDRYPMTILVPPPPPPPGQQPPLYVFTENKIPTPNAPSEHTERPTLLTRETTPSTEQLTSLYALQEANLIYQSSTTSQNWMLDLNQTKPIPNAVSTDYAGWGPTTPLYDNELANDTHNLISNDHIEVIRHPYTFYKPMLSEAPPPPQPTTTNLIFLPTFVPTALPATEVPQVPSVTQATKQDLETTTEIAFNISDYFEDISTPMPVVHKEKQPSTLSDFKTDKTIFDMLGPMMSMPLVNGPERPEDHLYAHASENFHVYKEHPTEDTKILETMQTMQPPPTSKVIETTTESDYYSKNPHIINKFVHKKPSKFTLDPYLHMRFTTLPPIKTTDASDSFKTTTEGVPLPMYLIIQGHSKVKTYSSKPDINQVHDTISNEIPKPNETTEVKHLHPIKEKKIEKSNTIRGSRSKNLKKLVEENYGSIEIQEADVGIHYDVSDGSDVPLEMYRTGIVETDENNYSSLKQNKNEERTKRQIDLEDLLPFDEDVIEKYVYNFFNRKKNSTGITGLIAQAITSDAASVVDDLEDDDEDNEHEEEER